MFARTLVAFVLLAGCSGGSSTMPGPGPMPGATTPGATTPGPTTPGPTTPGPTTPGPNDPTQGPAPKAPRLGESCGPDDGCGEGACVKYYGIAGARGPEFKTCEIRCGAGGACADGRKCMTIADGPGQVCR